MENILKQILGELQGIKTDVGDLKTDVGSLKTDVLELKTGQARLENGLQKLQKNFIESLDVNTEKITDHIDNRTEVLNKRVYHVESDIERLIRQQGS
ncbi:hypothetical protein FZC84_01085 [Rossellomorea vietnamensis]|uniref:Uncharacterized protein n=1 Tax=Rossellomorea vietnamensis TaxID=218284 RepID=A0A5D4MHZ3_9BACI|nr:hypothetical protein [Rossellomorea vietnamensis]TYS01282.1 hypothetical protein FZC84_01085 [Rossellomorea vietnamensis]